MAVELFISVFFLGFVSLLFIGYCMSSNSNEKEPPGPRPLPILGNLLKLDLKNLPESIWKLSAEYGTVFTTFLGAEKWVVLVGYETVKEALVEHSEAFGGRTPTVMMEETVQGHGITWSNGDTSREMRSLFLKDSFNVEDLKQKISEESEHLTNALKKLNGEAFDTFQTLNYATSNVICSVVYGARFQYDDPQYCTMIDQLYQRTLLSGSPSVKIYNLFSWMGRWVARSVREQILTIMDTFREENLVMFKRLRETLNPQKCRGFVDAFMVKQTQLQESGATDGVFTEENLVHSVMSLLVGTQSTSTVLTWLLLLMAKYSHIQDQVREEIFRVIGSRQVRMEDRADLPFTVAVIHETLRYANFAPMGIGRRTTQDINFKGYFIKKGTTVWPHLSSILFNESEWEKPHSFHPAHFLHTDGTFRKRDAFLPFSAGFRMCPGEGLARIELFTFCVTLMQRFRFTAPPGVTEEELDVTPTPGFITRPKPQSLCAVSLD